MTKKLPEPCPPCKANGQPQCGQEWCPWTPTNFTEVPPEAVGVIDTTRLGFGQHKGKTLLEVFDDDIGYFIYLLDEDFLKGNMRKELKRIAKNRRNRIQIAREDIALDRFDEYADPPWLDND